MGCRLLYVVGELRAGGSERQLYYLLKQMDRSCYQPEVVVWSFHEHDVYVPRLRALNVPLHSFPDGLSRMGKLARFRRMVRQISPEIVHSYSFYVNFAAYWAASGSNAIAIGGVRSDLDWAKDDAGPIVGRLSARWPRIQTFNSSKAVELARRSGKVFVPKECVVIRNGLDLDLFDSVPVPRNGMVRIVGVGSLFPVKRWDRLVEAAKVLKSAGLNFHVRVVGDGPLRQSLTAQARELDVSDRIEFIGHSDEIPRLLMDATFLVHTAEKEGSPNAVMEAMACGRAVVAMDAGDVPQLVDEGINGFVISSGNMTSLVSRMKTLIQDYDLCARMGSAGRLKAEREFGLDRLVSSTLDAYRDAGWKDAQVP